MSVGSDIKIDRIPAAPMEIPTQRMEHDMCIARSDRASPIQRICTHGSTTLDTRIMHPRKYPLRLGSHAMEHDTCIARSDWASLTQCICTEGSTATHNKTAT